ncbi:MAG: HD domain-containing protein [Myxococcales bacterium]|nr:HD domain-containing protein [Myxococcales bacterium]
MQQYYLHAKAVMREGDRLLDRASEAQARRPSVRVIDQSFVWWNGELSTRGPEVFRERPAEMVRIFRVALENGARVHGHTRDLIAEACARPETASRLAADPQAARDFIALLCDPRDRGAPPLPSVLEIIHDLGLLTALMPEFGPCSGRVQHDLCHVFTVDQHSLYAVAKLKAIARGELAEELPAATRAMAEVQGPLALYLGTLLHDVGKPLGKAHSEKGAVFALAIARRLRLDEAQSARIEFLVRHHLLIAHLSQRRDLNDGAMIGQLARQLGDEETLRQLYLLTVADMAMVSPQNLTSWKERLLRELFLRTLAHFRHGPDLAGEEGTKRVAQRKIRVAALLREPLSPLAPRRGGRRRPRPSDTQGQGMVRADRDRRRRAGAAGEDRRRAARVAGGRPRGPHRFARPGGSDGRDHRRVRGARPPGAPPLG